MELFNLLRNVYNSAKSCLVIVMGMKFLDSLQSTVGFYQGENSLWHSSLFHFVFFCCCLGDLELFLSHGSNRLSDYMQITADVFEADDGVAVCTVLLPECPRDLQTRSGCNA